MIQFLKKTLTWWNGQTLNTQFNTWLYGEKVGEDDQGNIYYRARKGTRRWVIYSGETEASRVGPDWHGWLHHTVDEPPTQKPIPQHKWAKPHQENLTGTSQAYAPTGSLRSPEQIAPDYEAWQPE